MKRDNEEHEGRNAIIEEKGHVSSFRPRLMEILGKGSYRRQ